jgi:hypothetical protein
MPGTFQSLTHEFSVSSNTTHSIRLRSTAGGVDLRKIKVTGDNVKFDDKKVKMSVLTGGSMGSGTDIAANVELVKGGATSNYEALYSASAGDGSNVIDVEFVNGATRGGDNIGLSVAQNGVIEVRFVVPTGLTNATNIAVSLLLER